MKKTSELTGALLDYWVARAEGLTDPKIVDGEVWSLEFLPFRPSRDWAQCGPLIEKYNLDLFSGTNPPEPFSWKADNGAGVFESGDTPLEAICRAVVRSVFGDEVGEVDDGL